MAVHGGGGGLRFSAKTEAKSTYTEQVKLYPLNVVKFRARIETADGQDVHRELSGGYFPRFRTLYVNEIKDTQKLGMRGVRLIPYIPEDVYLKPDKDYFYTSDFEIGKMLKIGPGKSPTDRDVVKTLVITDVDKSGIRYHTEAAPEKQAPKRSSVIENLLQRVREKVKSRGDGKLTIKRIGRHFKVVDDSGDRLLDTEEFGKALLEYDIGVTPEQVGLLMQEFDKNGDGMVSFDEFVECIRGPMSQERKMCVALAFKKIDYNKDGCLSRDDLSQFYSAKYHPKVVSGEATEDEILLKFLDKFDTRDKNGIVTYPEFLDYYSGVSANIDDDDHFIFMMERAWNLDSRNETRTPFR